MDDRIIIFFDSECMLCNASVQWILEHEHSHELYFAPLHGMTFNALPLDTESLPDSILVWKYPQLHIKSSAIQHLLYAMGGKWKVLSAMLNIVPFGLSDLIYDFIARKRYGWFGKTSECILMKGPMKHRFLD